MALKPCRECKKKVSTEAKTCPNCGVPNPTSSDEIKGKKFKGVIEIKKNKTTASLGIETLGGVFTTIIEKGSTLPATATMEFSTAEDNQPAVSIRVMIGNSDIASNNKILANAELTGIDPAPRGVPRIAVNFYIDEKGSLNISAADKKTKKGHQIKILKSGKSSSSQVSDLDIPSTPWSDNSNKSKPWNQREKNRSSFDKFLDGELDLATAFWGYGVGLSIVIGLITGYLTTAVHPGWGIAYVIGTMIIIIGLWKCATSYSEQKNKEKQSAVWGIIVKVICVLSVISVLNLALDLIKMLD
jgi:hypothetical protein